MCPLGQSNMFNSGAPINQPEIVLRVIVCLRYPVLGRSLLQPVVHVTHQNVVQPLSFSYSLMELKGIILIRAQPWFRLLFCVCNYITDGPEVTWTLSCESPSTKSRWSQVWSLLCHVSPPTHSTQAPTPHWNKAEFLPMEERNVLIQFVSVLTPLLLVD